MNYSILHKQIVELTSQYVQLFAGGIDELSKILDLLDMFTEFSCIS